MSNRFCIILNEGNKSLTMNTPLEDKVYRLKQGYLLIGDRTPYNVFNISSQSWHIIGHIDNLPLLNYLLYSYYPSQNDFISKKIICLAVKRYGMRIIELLQGNFCIIYEDAEGNLTLVTENETQRRPYNVPNGTGTDRTATLPPPPAAAVVLQKPYISTTPADGEPTRAMPACRCPQQPYSRSTRKIAITRWYDNHLQFIQSVSHPIYSEKETGAMNEIKEKVADIEKYSQPSN